MNKLISSIIVILLFFAFSGCISSDSSNNVVNDSNTAQKNLLAGEDTTVNSNSPNRSLVRCIDTTRQIQIEYPSDYTARIESYDEYKYLVIRSPFHKPDSDNPLQDMYDRRFSNMEYRCSYFSGGSFCKWYNSSEIEISDVVVYISGFTSSMYDIAASPLESEKYYEDYYSPLSADLFSCIIIFAPSSKNCDYFP
jgi:hypothetical protein